MILTSYSLLTAVLWSTVFIFLIHFLRRSTRGLLFAGVAPMIILGLGTALRCVFPVEFLSFSQEISLEGPVAALFHFFRSPLGSSSHTVGELLLLLWVLGAVALLVKFLVQCGRFWNKINRYEPIEEGKIQEAAEAVAGELGCPVPRLIVLSCLSTPQVTGFLRPVVLLPDFDYSREEYSYVLFHELTHWKNRDLWVLLCIELFCDVFWWNPLCFLLKKNLSHSLEIQCDSAVLKDKRPEEVEAYKDVLVKTLALGCEQKQTFVPYTVLELASGDEKAILQRMELVLNACSKLPGKKTASVLVSLSMVLLLALSYSVVIQPAYEPSIAEIEEGGNTYVDRESSYLVENPDGGYWVYVKNRQFPVDEDFGEKLIAEGYLLKNERG